MPTNGQGSIQALVPLTLFYVAGKRIKTWWRHQMETFSTLLFLCEVTCGFPSQRPVTRSFDVPFDLHLNKRMSNNRDAGDLRRRCAHRNITVMVNAPCGRHCRWCRVGLRNVDRDGLTPMCCWVRCQVGQCKGVPNWVSEGHPGSILYPVIIIMIKD